MAVGAVGACCAVRISIPVRTLIENAVARPVSECTAFRPLTRHIEVGRAREELARGRFVCQMVRGNPRDAGRRHAFRI